MRPLKLYVTFLLHVGLLPVNYACITNERVTEGYDRTNRSSLQGQGHAPLTPLLIIFKLMSPHMWVVNNDKRDDSINEAYN